MIDFSPLRQTARTSTVRFLLIVSVGFAAPAHAELPAGIKPVTTVEGVTEYRLDNGLRVLLIPDNSKPLVTANMVYRVGSRHEGPGEGGMAHLLEHLIFKGTPTTADPKTEFVQRGMQWNGTTSLDRTNYFATFSADTDTLDWYIGWLADSMVNSHISRRDLDSEMTVVRNEFERGEVRDDQVLYHTVLATAYQWHPYGKAVIGSRSDIENVSIESLQRFYRHYYQPDNAVLVVAGKIDPAQVLSRIASTFGKIPKPTRQLAPSYTLEPVQQGERNVTVSRIGSVPRVAVAYHAAAGGSKAYATQAVLRQILTTVPTGRLHKALVESGLASATFDWSQQTEDPGFMYLGAVLPEKADADKAQAALLGALERMEPVTEEEVARAKRIIVNSINRGLLDAQALGMSLTDSIATGDWRLRFALRDWISEVTVADVQKHARSYFVESNRTIGRFMPSEQQPVRAPLPMRADMAELLKDYKGKTAAAAVNAFEMTNLGIESRTVKSALPGGMKLAFLPRATKGDRVVGTLRLHWGTLESLTGKRIDAMLLPQMMLKGSATLSRADLGHKLSELDSSINVNGGLTGLTVDFGAPKENLQQVLELIADALRNPVFPENDFEQARRAFITGNQASQNDPGAMAGSTLGQHLTRYATDDPRSALSLPDWQKAAKSTSLKSMQAFYRSYAGASHAELAMVGPIDIAQTTEKLRSLLDDWRSPQEYKRIERPLQTVDARRIVLDMPEKANVAYTSVLPFEMNGDDPDMPALYTAVQLLGGRPGARLWNRLREKEGLSYSVQSYLSVGAQERNARIGITGSFAPENRERFEAALRDELQKALRDGFTSDEVRLAKESILRNRRQAITQEGNVVDVLADNLFWGHTLERREERDTQFSQLTPEQVNAALRKYLDIGKLSTVIAGDFPE